MIHEQVKHYLKSLPFIASYTTDIKFGMLYLLEPGLLVFEFFVVQCSPNLEHDFLLPLTQLFSLSMCCTRVIRIVKSALHTINLHSNERLLLVLVKEAVINAFIAVPVQCLKHF